MNDTATAGGASGASLIPSTTDAFTIAHLAVLAIFAIAVVAAIVWGARLKRRRRTAERDIAQHNSEVETAAPPPAPAPAPAPPPVRTPEPRRDPVAAPTAPTWEVTPVPAPPPAPAPSPDIASARDGIADEPIAATGPLEPTPAAEAASRMTGPVDTADEAGVEPDAAPPAPAAAEPPAPSPEVTPPASAPIAEAPVAAPAAPALSPADAPVSTLKGLGPKLAARLGELGFATVGQIAALSDDEAMRLDAQLGPFSGRMTRDRWIEQARFLAAGDTAGFESVFGRL
jgi:predicted flap endonuclease-1-like 5' DNA nuclease